MLDAHVDRLILIGDEMRPLAEQVVGTHLARPRRRTSTRRPTRCCGCSGPGDAVLVKASNSVGLAKLVERMVKGTGMLYVIAEQLGFPGILNLIRYISFRAGAASATALLIGLLLGPKFISWLRATQGKGQPIRADGPQSHLAKRGTPTMGGLLILISVSISVLLWMDLTNPYVWACLLVTAGFGLIGWLDDYDKVKKAHHAGLSGKTRLALEFLIAGVATWLMVRTGGTDAPSAVRQGDGRRPRLVLHPLRRVRDRRLRQCGEPDRRARRACDHAGDHRLHRLPADLLPRRQREVRRLISAFRTCRASAT